VAVGYLRRSTDRQEQSIPDRKKDIERYAVEHGLELARLFVDDGASCGRRGSWPTGRRIAVGVDPAPLSASTSLLTVRLRSTRLGVAQSVSSF
jgi:hypothetical protein